MLPVAAALLFLAAVCAMAVRGVLPFPVAALYMAASLTAVILYRVDKSAAASDRRRIPEDTLLVVGLLGGWPGALIAQALLRHKTYKPSFRVMFWMTVAANCVALAWFASRHG